MSVHNRLIATGESHVGQQIGTQHNSFVEHKETIYHTSPDDSPDQMHVVARAHLEGGNPRAAEAILRTLHHKGYATPERAYQYVLSILSDRSYGDIVTEQTDEIGHATTAVASEQLSEWQEALEVVNSLLRYAHAEYGDGAGDDELTTALKMFGALSVDRQDEIDTHLSRILSGAVHERLTAERKCQVAAQRMSGDRIERAWKFFEADPLPPGRWVTAPAPATAADWRDAVLGSVATVTAMTAMLMGEVTVGAVLGVALIVAGFVVSVRCTTVWQAHSRHVHSVWVHRQPQPYQQEGRFDKLIDRCFQNANLGGLWESTEGYRGHLKRRLQQQYGSWNCHPFELQWLIRWHVLRIGQGNDYPAARPAEAQRAANFRMAGVVVWVVVLVGLVLVGEYGVFVLAVGGWWGISGIARIVSVSLAERLLAQDAEMVLADELAEHHRWRQELANRPSDVEMERWLALDKAHLKNDALRRAGLRERDLVTYVVLIERAPFARKSRITGGPPRYEAYMVYIFLLTKFGMRTTRTFLDLTTGDVRNEQHQMCTYDAVASASVTEQGVRTFMADGSPSVDNRSGRVFRLMLLNGTCIAEVRENGRAIGDEASGGEHDLEDDAAAMPTAGFDSALRVLEAVATEGREWIARDRERKQRWVRNWCTRTPSGAETTSGRTNLH
ncbi:hypothetical protein [Nocardia colli]|uniref:hypothetical protein n=1 Tax=Nocardia colli TaxID=2545717 RepID=UPI0035DA4C42